MKPSRIVFVSALTLLIFFGIRGMTVETAIKTGFEKTIGTLAYWFGGSVNATNNRQLPPGQGDDSDSTITPIESLEDIK
mgnify:CR=1 FL=1|jgi:hypothetical protein